MAGLPLCERCGAGSWTGSIENPTCPRCHKPKTRGSREEMAKQIRDLRDVALNALGLLAGVSVADAETIQWRLVHVLKETE